MVLGFRGVVCGACLGLSIAVAAANAREPSPQPLPAADAEKLHAVLDPIMDQAVVAGNIPGGVLVVGHDGRIVYREAFGSRSLEPVREPMTVDTIFDLASLTKCLATATSVMDLIQEGRIRLNDPVAAYLPEFAQSGKQDITIRELLTHFSGLAPDLDLKQEWQGRDTAFRMAMEQKPIHPPGSRFVYSDINFEVLGFVVEKVTGMPLDAFAASHIFEPLGMKETRFLPVLSTIRRRGGWAEWPGMRACSRPRTTWPSSPRKCCTGRRC
jgi:CubicO group peptidase (beta-lactamase class C family)